MKIENKDNNHTGKSKIKKFRMVAIRLFPIALFAWASAVEIIGPGLDGLFVYIIINICFAVNVIFVPIPAILITAIFWSGVILTESGLTTKDIVSWAISLVIIGFILYVFTPLGDWIKKKIKDTDG